VADRSVRVTPNGDGTWVVGITARGKSADYLLTRPGPTLYLLEGADQGQPYVIDTAAGTCSCPAGVWKKACKHLDSLKTLERTGALDGHGEVTLDDERIADCVGC
jgi:hypothetical protein